MKKRFFSLNLKFFFIALAAAIIPAVAVGITMYRISIGIVAQKQEAAVRSSCQNISDAILGNLNYARNLSLNIIYNDDVRGALSLENPSKDVEVRWKNLLTSNFLFYTGMISYIDQIYLTGHNGFEVSIGTINQSLVQDNLTEITEACGGVVWKYMKTEEKSNLVLLREIRNIDNPNLSLGYLQIVIRNNIVEDQFENFLEAFPGYMALWDTDGTEILHCGEYLEKEGELKELLNESKDFDWINDNGILTYFSKVKDSQWVLAGSMKASDLFAENEMIRVMLIEVIVAALGISLIVVFIVGRLITKPLKQLTEQTKEISRDNYDIHLNIVSNDEIGILSEHFNEMARRLDELVNEVLHGKVLQQEAQFNALQAQINPHFLYNNLDTAYWMSRMEKAEKTGKILLALSALYRSTVNTKSKLISVEDEAKYAKEYITIQEMRLGNQIRFELHVEDDVKCLSTLRFILQPLIENSIEHGILPTGESGRISIRIYQEEQSLYFAVEDSGNGSTAEEINCILEAEHVEGRKGMAIRNIHQRIRIQYGQEYGLRFRQTDSGGILTIVQQPAVRYVKAPEN